MKLTGRRFVSAVLLAALSRAGCSAHSSPQDSIGQEPSRRTAQPASARDANVLRYSDTAGSNLLLLVRHATTQSDENGIVNRLTLHVTHHVATSDPSQPFREAWRHTEVVECEGLDFDGHFLDEVLRVEDLDGDGFAEILVGFSTFCGGGIDPRQIKLVLHTRDQDFVLEGESIVQPPDGPSFGGSFALTPHEDFITPPFREALLAGWARVRGGQRGRQP